MTIKHFAHLALLSLLLVLCGCDFSWGLPAPGYAYPGGLSAWAPRAGASANYTYYPRYEAYHYHHSGQFHYMSGKKWMAAAKLPAAESKDVLASPGVPFHFTRHPSYYHSMVRQAYPSTWTPGKSRYDEPYQWGHSGWDIDRR